MASLESLKAQKASGFRGRVVYDHLAALYTLAGPAAVAGKFCGHGFKHDLSLSVFAVAGRYPGRVRDKKRLGNPLGLGRSAYQLERQWGAHSCGSIG